MKKFTIEFEWSNLSDLKIGATYKKDDTLIWNSEYKTPQNFSDLRNVFETAVYNIKIDYLRFKMFLWGQEYRLAELKEIWKNGKRWCIACFVVASSMIVSAGAVANYKQNQFDVVNSSKVIVCNDNSLAMSGTPPIQSKTQVKKAAKKFAQEQRKKWKKEQLAKEIANATEGVAEVLPKLTKEYKTDKLGWWKVEANNISSGTFVGKFTDNQFKVSEQEKIRRLKTVYEFLKQYENEDWKINAKFLSIQWAYETNWGQSKLSNLAANCGGMKTFDKSEPFVYADDDGQDLESNGHSMFKKFYSIEDGLRYWVGEFYQKGLYKQARNNYKDFNAFGYSIQHLYFDKKHNRWVKYAENPNYLSTINKIYQRNEKHLI